jgi:hypothetical protein
MDTILRETFIYINKHHMVSLLITFVGEYSQILWRLSNYWLIIYATNSLPFTQAKFHPVPCHLNALHTIQRYIFKVLLNIIL